MQESSFEYWLDWRQVVYAYIVGQITEQEHEEEIANLRMIYGVQEDELFYRKEKKPVSGQPPHILSDQLV